jgi:uncharacterized protein (TIGR03437 family)
MLNGTYYIRQVLYVVQVSQEPEGTLGDAINTYGNITFDGNGNYTFSGWYLDAANDTATPTQFTGAGSYVISAAGMGYITAINPELNATDQIIGLVSAKGIFIGSSTQNPEGYNDLVVAAPVGTAQATNATLNGTYKIAYMDPTFLPTLSSSGIPGGDALISMTANGQGGIGTVNVTGYVGTGTGPSSETLTGVTYAFTNGAAQVNFGGNDTALVEGSELLYISPDGNFVFGGSANGFDIFVGVRAATANPTTYDALYYQAGLDLDQSQAEANEYVLLDSYYGALSVFTGNIIGHQSLNDQLVYNPEVGNNVEAAAAADFTYYDAYTLNGDGSSTDEDFGQEYFSSTDGTIRIGYGVPNVSVGLDLLSINVALQAPTLTGPGVYLSPEGVVNAASSVPFTAHLSPGEYITLYGSGLAASDASAPSLPLPTKLNGVQVMINGIAAPVNFVSPTQINVVVPFETSQAVAQIQVSNNGTLSNTVTQFVGTSSAGVFTHDPAYGYGYADAQDVTAGYSLVGASNPAQIGDTIAVYLAGLGALTSNVADGAAGPATSTTFYEPSVYIDDSAGNSTQATPLLYYGLAPGFAGLYQIDFTVPSGVASGPAALEIVAGLNAAGGPDSDTIESGFQVGTSSDATPAARLKSAKRLRIHHPRLLRQPVSAGTKLSPLFDPQRGQR